METLTSRVLGNGNDQIWKEGVMCCKDLYLITTVTK